jgi:hypothetical protein
MRSPAQGPGYEGAGQLAVVDVEPLRGREERARVPGRRVRERGQEEVQVEPGQAARAQAARRGGLGQPALPARLDAVMPHVGRVAEEQRGAGRAVEDRRAVVGHQHGCASGHAGHGQAGARAVAAASGSSSTPTRRACGNACPAPTRKRPEPVPGSATRAGETSPCAHASMASTMGRGVYVAPMGRRRSAGAQRAKRIAERVVARQHDRADRVQTMRLERTRTGDERGLAGRPPGHVLGPQRGAHARQLVLVADELRVPGGSASSEDATARAGKLD